MKQPPHPPEAPPRGPEARRDDLRSLHGQVLPILPLPFDPPTERQDFDYIRWYLLHEGTSAFVDQGTWHLIVHSHCRHLEADNRCGIYEARPQICRDYTTKDCEYEDDWVYEQYFETPGQVEEFREVVLPPRRGARIRSPRHGLPVLRTTMSPR